MNHQEYWQRAKKKQSCLRAELTPCQVGNCRSTNPKCQHIIASGKEGSRKAQFLAHLVDTIPSRNWRSSNQSSNTIHQWYQSESGFNKHFRRTGPTSGFRTNQKTLPPQIPIISFCQEGKQQYLNRLFCINTNVPVSEIRSYIPSKLRQRLHAT